MSGVKNYTYTTLKQAILDYAEVDDTVFTTTILDGFICLLNLEYIKSFLWILKDLFKKVH